MKTLEILFTNRRKEKLTAETVSLTEAPGWVILKTGGAVAEMIPASVIRRIRFLATPADETETAVPVPVPTVASASPSPYGRAARTMAGASNCRYGHSMPR